MSIDNKARGEEQQKLTPELLHRLDFLLRYHRQYNGALERDVSIRRDYIQTWIKFEEASQNTSHLERNKVIMESYGCGEDYHERHAIHDFFDRHILGTKVCPEIMEVFERQAGIYGYHY